MAIIAGALSDYQDSRRVYKGGMRMEQGEHIRGRMDTEQVPGQWQGANSQGKR